MFDIKDFYQSIKETLLIKAINFDENLVNITNEDKVIIKHARKSLLYDNSEPWMKKDKIDIGLYRDDGLAIFENVSDPKSEKIKKDIQKLFKENQLDIVIQFNMKTVNYLDVTLNLKSSTYRPYQKKKSN